MLRVCLIGPGDTDFYYQKILNMSAFVLENQIKSIAEKLYDLDVEIALLPDRGISIKIAEEFKKLGGKVIGLAPLSDKLNKVSHLKPYIKKKIFNKTLFDIIIDTIDWSNHDQNITLFGDIVLYLGNSPGTLRELASGIYMYKIVKGLKQNVTQPLSSIHKQARAGTKIPYTILIYKPFLKTKKLPKEIEEYIKKLNINLIYISNPNQLKIKIGSLQKTPQ